MSGENLDPLLQKPLSKACILSCRSEKTVLNFFTNLFKIGSHTPLYYIEIINFLINPLNPLSLTAMPLGRGEQRKSERYRFFAPLGPGKRRTGAMRISPKAKSMKFYA